MFLSGSWTTLLKKSEKEGGWLKQDRCKIWFRHSNPGISLANWRRCVSEILAQNVDLVHFSTVFCNVALRRLRRTHTGGEPLRRDRTPRVPKMIRRRRYGGRTIMVAGNQRNATPPKQNNIASDYCSLSTISKQQQQQQQSSRPQDDDNDRVALDLTTGLDRIESNRTVYL
jgi:hypothetical protein